MAQEEMNQLDIEALSAPFEILQSKNGLVLLRSQESEKLLVLDELFDTEELHSGDVFIRSSAYERIKEALNTGAEKFISLQEEGERLLSERASERAAVETDSDRQYREYLYSMREEVGEQFLDFAMPREVYFNQVDERQQEQPQEQKQAEQSEPTYDIHDTYHNDKLYEKNTPLNLRSRQQFVCWKYEWLGGKWKKIPYNPNNGLKASSISYKTWSNFETACKAVDKYNFDGVGIMFSKGLMGIDIDHCIDDNGQITESAREIIDTVNSYTELSPSGKGVHILTFGELPGERSRTGDYEMYCKGRFFTLTGKLFENTFRKIPKASETEAAIKLMYDKYINVKRDLFHTPAPVSDSQLTYSDEEILKKCRKSRNADRFETLWRGDWSAYLNKGEQSSADNALVGMLAYYSDDVNQIDRLFRQSGLMRPKWDEYRGDRTYGQITINSVLTAPNRPRYNPKYFYETQIKPKFQKSESNTEWSTLKLTEDNFVKDYARCKEFKITQGNLAGAIFFYPSNLIKKTEEGYNLQVKSDFTFKVRPKGSQSDIELSGAELRKALKGQSISKKPEQNATDTGLQEKKQTEFE